MGHNLMLVGGGKIPWSLTANFQLDELGLRWIGRQLALVEALIILPDVLYA